MLVEWATHWDYTAQFEDFSVEAKNEEGDYQSVECLEYDYT